MKDLPNIFTKINVQILELLSREKLHIREIAGRIKCSPAKVHACIKIFKKNVLGKILPRLVEKKFAGDLEMLVVADTLGFKRIFEAPVKLDYSLGPLTTAATFDAIWNIFIDTLAIWYRKNLLRYYSRPHTI